MSHSEAHALDIARAERERRRRAHRASFPNYGDWLEQACPNLNWRYAWLRYVQGFYDQVTAGRITRLMIFAPPQHGKSEGGTIRYPVHRLERDDRTRCIVACHTQALANKFSRKSKSLADRRLKLARDKKAVSEWETAAGGGMKAVGVGGSISGFPADLGFIDDPIKSRQAANSPTVRDSVWDWYTDEFSTRVQQGGAIILQMTRWHLDDLAGRILASADGPNWTVVSLAALAEEGDPLGRAVGEALCPERFSRDELLRRQAIMRLSFAALFQQRPTALEGELFKRDHFRVVPFPLVLNIVARVRFWDLAATNGDGDFTVGARLAKTADGQVWVESIVRGQWGPTERDRIIRATAESDPKGTRQVFEQEPGSAGVTVKVAMARLLAGFTVESIPSVGSKELRADPWASQVGADNVRLVPGLWNAAFIAEHVDFPNGVHDDQVDAASGAYSKLIGKRQSWAA